MKSRRKPSRSEMASNKVDCWAPHLSVWFSAMLKPAFHEDTDSMAIRYRSDRRLFNLRKLQARSKVKDERVHDFLFADDCALNARSEDEMQRNRDIFPSAFDAFGLTISTKKTEVMFQPAPHTHHAYPTTTAITVMGQKL